MNSKLALVTGGSRGIGRAICETLLDAGYEVVFFAHKDSAAQVFLSESGSLNLHYIHCDVSNPKEIAAASAEVRDSFGTVSVLINNAGIQTHCSFLDMTPEIWQQTIDVDLNSLFYICKEFVPAMIEQGYGRIVNLSSMSALRGSNRHIHYNTAKSGVLGFTRGLSCEIARYGITVNAICPGAVETDIIQDYVDAKRDEWLTQMHVKRLGTPEDISNIVRFLISEESGWITGQALHVNGGLLTP